MALDQSSSNIYFDYCPNSTIYTLGKQKETKLKREKKTKNKRRKTKRKEIRNCWKWENCLTADG